LRRHFVRRNLPFVATYEGVLEALGDGTRRQILAQLASGPAAVADLASQLPVSRPAVSQHLRVLLESGLVAFDRQGTRNIYRLEREGLATLRAWLDDFWQTALDGYEAFARNRYEEVHPDDHRPPHRTVRGAPQARDRPAAS